MSSFFIGFLLLLVQLLTGWGVLTLFRVQLKAALFPAVAILLGIAVFSIVPFILQLCYIPITPTTVFIALLLATVGLNLRLPAGLRMLKTIMREADFRLELYELPFLLTILFIIFVSAWRCFYFPPTPVDITTGAEVIAEYTIREKTMINTVFQVTPTGNTLKPPFITSLQVIYKMVGFPFGQIWLSNVFICFIMILYNALNTTLHRLLSGLLILFFLAIPEMYAYTFMILFDYSNAVFFFLSVFFLVSWFKDHRVSDLVFSGLLMGIATYMRPETLLLSFFLLPAVWRHTSKHRLGLARQLWSKAVFLAPSTLLYTVSVYIYIHYYLPQPYSIADQINPALWNIKSLLQRFADTNRMLVFSKQGIDYYGYFIFLFLGLLLAELIVKRRFSSAAKSWLYAVMVVYIFFPLLSHILPGVSIENTVKRAFFKLFPLMLLYMANNGLLIGLSQRITRWESLHPKPV